MEYRQLTDRVKIPVMGIGTWGMGGEFYRDTGRDRDDIKALETAIELGMTHIDTAEMYASGHTEELVGAVVKDFKREELFITSKVWQDSLSYRGVISAVKGSLKRMGTGYLDLYLIHWPNPQFPLRETMRAMDDILAQGSTRFVGVSNFSVELMEEAQSCSKNKIVANQVEYSLLVREPEDEILPYCQKHGVMLISYKPLARGILTKPGFNTLDELVEKYGKTRAQISLNWLHQKEKVVSIPKATNLNHLKENLGSIEWKLTKEDIDRLDKEFRG